MTKQKNIRTELGDPTPRVPRQSKRGGIKTTMREKVDNTPTKVNKSGLAR